MCVFVCFTCLRPAGYAGDGKINGMGCRDGENLHHYMYVCVYIYVYVYMVSISCFVRASTACACMYVNMYVCMYVCFHLLLPFRWATVELMEWGTL